MGRYCSDTDVELRLKGKVRFTDDPEDENKFPRSLLKRLIKEAEGKIERDLAPRYAAPFAHENCVGDFSTLPDTTKETLRTMAELMSVIRVLGNDFGRGTVNDGSKFKEEQEKLYKEAVDHELSHRNDTDTAAWKWPPMDSLKTSLINATDTGAHGTIINTNPCARDEGSFPSDQITDPSENWANGRIE